MTWDINDVDRHKKGMSTGSKKKWVRMANAILDKCESGEGGIGPTGSCEGKAISIASSKTGPKKKLSDWVLEQELTDEEKQRKKEQANRKRRETLEKKGEKRKKRFLGAIGTSGVLGATIGGVKGYSKKDYVNSKYIERQKEKLKQKMNKPLETKQVKPGHYEVVKPKNYKKIFKKKVNSMRRSRARQKGYRGALTGTGYGLIATGVGTMAYQKYRSMKNQRMLKKREQRKRDKNK